MSKPRRALIVIDVQNDYVDGALPIEYPNVQHSLANIGRVMDAAHAARIPVVVIQHTAPAGSPVFAHTTRGWALHDVVGLRPRDHYISKALPSAFVGTDLGVWLQQHAIDTLTIVGYMTHHCDDSTVRDAMHRGFAVEFVSDAAGALSYANRAGNASAEEIHRVFTVVMQSRFAAVANTDEWIAALATAEAWTPDTMYASNQRARPRPLLGAAVDLRAHPPALRGLAAGDAERIAAWPPYPEAFREIDYAVRAQGWLQEFCGQTGAHCFVAEESGGLIAFTILATTAESEAEFRIALRPDKIGSGLGGVLAADTLAIGFSEFGLTRVHLIVRTQNPRALRLYERLGFVKRGVCHKRYNGAPVPFLVMDLSREQWMRGTRPAPERCSEPALPA